MADTMYPVNDNTGLLAELINANGRNCQDLNGMWNNPFMYLIWLALFGNGGFGFGNNRVNSQDIQNNEFMSRLNSIERQMNDNHANQLAMDAIKGNGSAIHELAGNLNVGVTALNTAIGGIHAQMDRLGDQIGMTREGIMGAVAMGSKDIVQKLCESCCKTNENITKMGYETLIRDLQNLNSLQTQINGVNQTIINGFSQVGYEAQRHTCDIINANKDNTQKIIDTLNTHWNLETSQALQDAKFEISQLKQNLYLISQLKTTA